MVSATARDADAAAANDSAAAVPTQLRRQHAMLMLRLPMQIRKANRDAAAGRGLGVPAGIVARAAVADSVGLRGPQRRTVTDIVGAPR